MTGTVKGERMPEQTENPYIKVARCELCGRKLWKGYFLMVPDQIQSMLIKIVCWRCKLFGRKDA